MLDHIAHRADWSLSNQHGIGHHVFIGNPVQHRQGAIDGITFIAGDDQADAAVAFMMPADPVKCGGDKCGNPAFHVNRANMDDTIFNGAAERIMLPCRRITGRDNIVCPAQDVCAATGKEITDGASPEPKGSLWQVNPAAFSLLSRSSAPPSAGVTDGQRINSCKS